MCVLSFSGVFSKIRMYLLPLISFIKKKTVRFGDLGGVGGAVHVAPMPSSLI